MITIITIPMPHPRNSHRCVRMADQSTVRKIALTLPGTTEGAESFAFSVTNKGKQKGYVWSWKERIDPKKARVESSTVVAIRVAGEDDKQMLLAADERKFFTEAHYNGYPAILVRLAEIEEEELRELLIDGWKCLAPKELIESSGL